MTVENDITFEIPDSLTSAEKNWFSRFRTLRKFVAREGHSRVQARHKEGGIILGRWVRGQRQRRDTLAEWQRAALESLPGWMWEGRAGHWDYNLSLLEGYVAREGHALVPKLHLEDGQKLGIWVQHQRQDYRSGKLPEENRELLEQVPGWEWSPRKGGRRVLAVSASIHRKSTDVDHEELVEAVWTVLFGLGPIAVEQAIDICAGKLLSDGMISPKAAARGRQRERLFHELFATALAYDYIDEPTTGFYRAVIRDATLFQSEDWELCVERSSTSAPLSRAAGIRDAARWARDNLGLDIAEVHEESYVWKQLGAAFKRLSE